MLLGHYGKHRAPDLLVTGLHETMTCNADLGKGRNGLVGKRILNMGRRLHVEWILAITAVVVATVFYIAGYGWLVRPEPIDVSPLGGERYVYAHYPAYDAALQSVFYPANQMDRVIRRELWWTDTCTAPGKLSYVRTRE